MPPRPTAHVLAQVTWHSNPTSDYKMAVFLLVSLLLLTEPLASSTTASEENDSALIPLDSRCVDVELVLCHPQQPSNSTCPAGTHLGSHENAELTAGGVISYLTLLALPVFLGFPFLVLLNIKLTSGPRHSFIFFYQTLAIVVLLDSNPQFAYLHSGFIIWGILVLNNIFSDLLATNSLHYLILNYFSFLYLIIFVFALLLLRRCYWRLLPRCNPCWAHVQSKISKWKRKQGLVDGSIVQGMCSIFLLSYMLMVQSSFTLLISSECCCGQEACPRFCQDIEYLSSEHAPFYGVAITVLIFCTAVPIVFICYPMVPNIIRALRRNPGPEPNDSNPTLVHSIFDAFQDVYKPKLRFFAGLHLLYRITLWTAFALIPNLALRTFTVSVHITLILVIHAIVQPFKEQRHNYIEGLMLLNLLIILEINQGLFFVPKLEDRIGLQALIYILALVPLACGITYIIMKIAQRCYQKRRSKWHRIQRGGEPDTSDEGIGDETAYNGL